MVSEQGTWLRPFKLSDSCLMPLQITLDEFGTGFAFSISAALANRLLIAVRVTYYQWYEATREFSDMNTSMGFRVSDTEGNDTECETTGVTRSRWNEATGHEAIQEYEMDNFSESRGF